MQKFHFSLVSLLAVIAVAAIGCAALARPTEVWTSTAVTLCVALLFLALLKLVYCDRTRRAFWTGFVIFGWGYLLLDRMVLQFPGLDEQRLMTTKLLEQLADVVGGKTPVGYPYAVGVYASPPMISTGPPATFVASDPLVGSEAAPIAERGSLENSADVSTASRADAAGSPGPAAWDPYAATPSQPANAPASSYEPVALPPEPSMPATPTSAVSLIASDPIALQRFMQTGQYLWAIVIGLIGGVLASRMHAKLRQPSSDSQSESEERPIES